MAAKEQLGKTSIKGVFFLSTDFVFINLPQKPEIYQLFSNIAGFETMTLR